MLGVGKAQVSASISPRQVETVKGRSDAALKRVNYTSWTTKLATTWSLRATPVLAHGGSSA